MNKCERARILILAPNAPGQGFGGAERHLQDLAKVLRPISQSVIFRSYQDASPPFWWERIVTWIEPMLASPLAVKRLKLPDTDVVLSVELMGVGLKHSGHIHLFFGSYSGFRDLALQPVSGHYAVIRRVKSWIARILEKRTQHQLGAVANSKGLRNELQARCIPILEDVLLPPTDCNRFSPGDKQAARVALGLPLDKRLILFAGRWEYAKGADRISKFYTFMPQDWHMVIVTPSNFTYTPLSGPQVTILTDLQTNQMIEAYRAADVLVQPSRFEGYSLVVSEAQACGCPVLTSPVGQAANLLESNDQLIRSSVINSPDDANMWLNAIAKILESDHIHDNFSKAHRMYALSSVSYEVVQAAWQQFLSKVFTSYSWQSH